MPASSFFKTFRYILRKITFFVKYCRPKLVKSWLWSQFFTVPYRSEQLTTSTELTYAIAENAFFFACLTDAVSVGGSVTFSHQKG